MTTQAPLFVELAPLLDDKLQASLARVAREHREVLLARFAHYGLVVDVSDPAAVAEADAQIERIRDERKTLVTQGWTWMRGRQERIADLQKPVSADSINDAFAESSATTETREQVIARMREADDVF
ncbi:MAG: hypothetical protein RIS45_14 [Planctomycetota bacterium]